ncbi:MAG: hypothetical protein AAGC54_16310 [Cyanobacteria bacterium P01_F01_bin.4]
MRYRYRSFRLTLTSLALIGLGLGGVSCRPGASEGVLISNDDASETLLSDRLPSDKSAADAPTSDAPTFDQGITDASGSINSLLVETTPSAQHSLHPLEKEQVSINRFGAIRVGMSIEEASQATGVDFLPMSGPQAVCQYYEPADQAIKGLGLMVIDGKVIRFDIWPGSPVTTLSGIGIGSTEAEIRASYPDQLEEAPHDYTLGKYLTFTAPGDVRNLYRLVFETDQNGVVTQYRAGQFPAVTWLEGCS